MRQLKARRRMGGLNKEELIKALVRKRRAWQDAIATAENKIDAIDRITERIASSKKAGKFHEMTDEQWAWHLVKMVTDLTGLIDGISLIKLGSKSIPIKTGCNYRKIARNR